MENITPDKWLGNHPDYILDLRRQQYSYPSEFRVDVAIPTQEPISLFGSRPDKIFDLTREQYLYPTNVWNPNIKFEVITEDKIAGYHPDRIYDIPRNQYLYPSSTIDTVQLTQHERITVDKWFREIEKPVWGIKRQQYTYSSEFRTEILEPVSQPINSESYHPDYIFDLRRQQYTYPATASFDFTEIPAQEPWTEFSYHPDFVLDLKRQQYTYSYFSFDPQPFAKNIFADSWHPKVEEPPKDITRLQYFYPTFFSSSIPIFTGVIIPQMVSTPIVYTTRTQYQAYFIVRFGFENAFSDRWLGYHPDYIFDIKRQQYTYPVTAAFDFLEIPTQEPITSFSYHPDKIFDIVRNQYLYPPFTVDPIQLTQKEKITIDKWIGNKPDYIFDLKRLQYVYPFIFPNNRIVYPLHVLVEPKPGGTSSYKPAIAGSTIDKLAHISGNTTDKKGKLTGHTLTYKPAPTGSTTSKLSAPSSGHTIDGDNTE